MKKFSSILFFASLLAFVACKDSKTTEETKDAAATTEATTAAPEATATTAPAEPTATPTATLDPAAAPPQSDAKAAAPSGPITSVQFEETTYNFGTVKDGDKVKHVYKFKNTGKAPLIISDAKGSCGCTVPDWPREPIAPGASAEIKIDFDSKGKGSDDGSKQTKRVTVTANTNPAQTYLTISGVVKKDPNAKPATPGTSAN